MSEGNQIWFLRENTFSGYGMLEIHYTALSLKIASYGNHSELNVTREREMNWTWFCRKGI
jgi:hypothetical protein